MSAVEHFSAIAGRALKRAKAFGREHYADKCTRCKGAGAIPTRKGSWRAWFWGNERETCPRCKGSRHEPLGDHLGESEALARDIDLMALELDRFEGVAHDMRRYCVRAEDLQMIFERAGLRPRLPIQTDNPPDA
jgi:hypothetical protein